MKWIQMFGGRKYFLVLQILYLSFIALLCGKISDTVWQFIVLGLVGFYAGANVYQKIKVRMGKKK